MRRVVGLALLVAVVALGVAPAAHAVLPPAGPATAPPSTGVGGVTQVVPDRTAPDGGAATPAASSRSSTGRRVLTVVAAVIALASVVALCLLAKSRTDNVRR
jgi:hypothetical protein